MNIKDEISLKSKELQNKLNAHEDLNQDEILFLFLLSLLEEESI